MTAGQTIRNHWDGLRRSRLLEGGRKMRSPRQQRLLQRVSERSNEHRVAHSARTGAREEKAGRERRREGRH